MQTKIKFLLLLLICNTGFCQRFIPIDEATLEFIQDVNYIMYKGTEKVFSGTCKNDTITTLPSAIDFNSILFSKVGYKTLGLNKNEIVETLFLTKEVFDLDEVFIAPSKEKEIILGEQNRFLKRANRMISKDMYFGVAFENPYSNDIEITKIVFTTDKVTYKTAYRFNIYALNETPILIGHQIAAIGDLLYSTPVTYLQPKQKGKIEILLDKPFVIDNKRVFVSPELIGYYDENDVEVVPTKKEKTYVRGQFSERGDYFSKMADFYTRITTDYLYNINAMTRYDFAFGFFKKPHKSNLSSLAILLYARKVE